MSAFFLTGVTGNLGCEILASILRVRDNTARVLVRANSHFEATVRVQQLGMALGIAEKDIIERVKIFVGDLRQPQLGLRKSDVDEISCESDVIIHSAAALSLKLPYDEARRSTLVPADNVVELALTKKSLKRFVLISTVGVGGLDYRVLPESICLNTSNFRNSYERVKYESEELVTSRLKDFAPTLIVRPSMIVGNSETGKMLKPQIFASICRLLTGELSRGYVPNLNSFHLDTIPADIVAEASVRASVAAPENSIELLHLCAGAKMSISFGELEQRVLAQLSDAPASRKVLGLSDFHAALPMIEYSLSPPEKKRLAFLPFMLDYFNFEQEFENGLSLEVLRRHNISPPLPVNYIGASIDAVLSPKVRAKNINLLQKRSDMQNRAGNE